ncbi:uncharacterized protein LOC135808894 isoform X3 [Sycon ciliatum]|uniref:uncharacterized protein LOC135808894 isoform X3 n=1 Tax=Sycon ciliatum TaxID=27933 RepID=UPI0031F69483
MSPQIILPILATVLVALAASPSEANPIIYGSMTCHNRSDVNQILHQEDYTNGFFAFFQFGRDTVSHEYYPNMECNLDFSAIGGRPVSVIFHPCTLPIGNTCSQDSLTVSTAASNPHTVVCSDDPAADPGVIDTGDSTMSIKFLTDASGQTVGCAGSLWGVPPS